MTAQLEEVFSGCKNFYRKYSKNMRSGRNRKRNRVEISFLLEDECEIRAELDFDVIFRS